MASWPLSCTSLPASLLSSLKPSSMRSGVGFWWVRADVSAHERNLAKFWIAASSREVWRKTMVLLTSSATFFLRAGRSSAASSGVRLSCGKMRRAMVFSRSSKNCSFVDARGPSCCVAKSKAGIISPLLHCRISSTSCSRSSEKCSFGSLSRIYSNMLEKSPRHVIRVTEIHMSR